MESSLQRLPSTTGLLRKISGLSLQMTHRGDLISRGSICDIKYASTSSLTSHCHLHKLKCIKLGEKVPTHTHTHSHTHTHTHTLESHTCRMSAVMIEWSCNTAPGICLMKVTDPLPTGGALWEGACKVHKYLSFPLFLSTTFLWAFLSVHDLVVMTGQSNNQYISSIRVFANVTSNSLLWKSFFSIFKVLKLWNNKLCRHALLLDKYFFIIIK